MLITVCKLTRDLQQKGVRQTAVKHVLGVYVCMYVCMNTHTHKDRREAVVFPCDQCRNSIYMKNIFIGNPEGMRQCHNIVNAQDVTHTIFT